MALRLTLVALAVAVMVGLLVYSQMRPEPFKISGFIEADEIRLGSRVGGRVKEILVEEGALVVAEQPLVELEPFDLAERRQQAEANLQGLEAELAKLEAGNRPEEVKQAEAKYLQLAAGVAKLEKGPRMEERQIAEDQLALAQSKLTRAEQSHTRITGLYRRGAGAVTEDDVEKVTEELKVAQAQRDVRKHELEEIKNGTRPEDLDEARQMMEEAKLAWDLMKAGPRAEDKQKAAAARDAAQAALAALDKERDELTIRAPQRFKSKTATAATSSDTAKPSADFVVEALDLRPGDLVSASAPILSVVDHTRLWVRAYVPENRLNFQIGHPVTVTLDSFPGQEFPGEVTFISRQGEFTPSNVQTPEERTKQVFRIKVTITKGSEKLRPGMIADVWLEKPTATK